MKNNRNILGREDMLPAKDIAELSIVNRTFYLWLVAKRPSKTTSDIDSFFFYLKFLLAYIYFNCIFEKYHKFITWITQYYPFSLLYRGSLFHADAKKATTLMRMMEASAKRAGIHIHIGGGVHENVLSIFYGVFDKKVANKRDAIEKLQTLFQKRYGIVYVQEQKNGFRILVDSDLV